MSQRILRLLLIAAAGLVVLIAAGCESKLTWENYESIEMGMSLTRVQQILGPGEDQTSVGGEISSAGVLSGGDQPKERVYAWEEGNIRIIITFEGGQVVHKRQIGLSEEEQ